MANNEKLKTLWTPEEARKFGRLGGVASGVARREKRTFRAALACMLSLPAEELDMSQREAVAVALLQKALTGDVKAFEAVRDTVGEKPVDAVKIDVNSRIADMSLEEKEMEAKRMALELGIINEVKQNKGSQEEESES